MKTIKRYSIQYSTKQSPISRLLTPILLLAGMATALLYLSTVCGNAKPAAGIGYLMYHPKR